MGWWPFGKKSARTPINNDPILKDTRTWLAELRDACELNFDQPEEARRQIRHMQVEWRDAMERGDMSPALREGLEGRLSIANLQRQRVDGVAGQPQLLESRMEARAGR